ncbi:MAG: rhamnulokinase family protein [Bacteroidales bacterium]|nr:rhamnulokinase family protein [Bacteroidales bacterium]
MNFFAIDLGATSGRTILGTLENGRLTQRELTRFQNHIIQTCGHWHWDLLSLYREILEGLKLVAREGIAIQSIGIDTWGCDFALFGKDGGLLRQPYCYRDPHTEGAMGAFFERMPREKVYNKTGIQFMPFNSLFQLDTLRRNHDSALEVTDKILFIPDALIYMLTGEQVCEYTVLSTSQMLDPRTKRMDDELLRLIGLDEHRFGRYVQPGEQVGVLSDEVQRLTGLGAIPVVAVAGHDTGSAVAAVPAENERFAYLSCGTWSLLGIEVPDAIINEKSFAYNFTNEGGIEGTTRFLKNICGMWLLEQSRRERPTPQPLPCREGSGHSEQLEPSFNNTPEDKVSTPRPTREGTGGGSLWPSDVNQINRDAMEATPFQSFINPDDPRFANPTSMVDAIQSYCRETGQSVPQNYKALARCIFESLAMRYRQVLGMLSELAPFAIERLHVIGGGSRNPYLMQMTADSIGLPVVTGPVEGTAIGNIMLQAKAAGLVSDRFAMRRIIARSVDMKTYEPQDTDSWNKAYERYLVTC